MEIEKEPHNQPDAVAEGMPVLFTVSEVANYLQVSNPTVYRLIRDGNLAGIKIGQSLCSTRKSIEDAIALSSSYNGV